MARPALGVCAIWVVLAAGSAAAAPSINLASHRAIYDLTLDNGGEGSDVASISGRMVMEFTGSECAGYTTKLRFVTQTQDPDGNDQVIDSRSDLFEARDGKSLNFSNETYTDNSLSEESRGSASRKDSDVAVALTKPAAKKFGLPASVVFPTEQLETIIDGARSGKRFLNLKVYDGSEDGETVFTIAAVIGAEAHESNDSGDEAIVKDAGLAGVRHWPVTISYFKDEPGDSMPDYVMSFVVYENGIGRALKINYGNFALIGRLTRLDLLPASPCK
jgi:hypothetical protein